MTARENGTLPKERQEKMNDFTDIISRQLSLKSRQVEGTITLLGEGATVPFIARYRKERTGSLDETEIIAVRDLLEKLRELTKRKEAVIRSITEQEKMTPVLLGQIESAGSMAALEDIYLPYRPKRRTRAAAARERGLEPLAKLLLEGKEENPEKAALRYTDPDRNITTAEDALSGARDIIAELISEDADVRSRLRDYFSHKAFIISKSVKKKEKEGIKYRDYFDWREPAAQAPSHRILAMFRGAGEGFLTVHLRPDEEKAADLIWNEWKHGQKVSRSKGCREQIKQALADSYMRLLAPSLETELKNSVKASADREAVTVFADNVRELLLSPPLGEKSVLAVDPGLRTGCKIVCLDRQGTLLDTATVYPLPPKNDREGAEKILTGLAEKYSVEAVAVGNGTGGREAQAFLESIDFPGKPLIVPVNESGASIYSASDIARKEFPDHDVTVRGAVSIGRRLMDPLSELVKIDPKSIGVGQYQHDVDQKMLKQALDDTVESCVNSVGVEVNTASAALLQYVSGMNSRTAAGIVKHREKNGPFHDREALRGAAGFGEKSFEQAAGFLRIRDGENPLDSSAVHPESYPIVEAMARDLNCSVSDLMEDGELRKRIEPEKYISDSTGLPTLQDILRELEKPGRDPRDTFEAFSFSDQVHTPEDLEEGMVLPGIVTNVTNFGAFVDVGVHQDGLVHISQLSDGFVKNPHDFVKVSQKVSVKVISVDPERNRISLTMRTG